MMKQKNSNLESYLRIKPILLCKLYLDLNKSTEIMLIRLYKTLIKSVLCNGSVTWTLTQMTEQTPYTFGSRILRRIYGPIQDERRWRPRRNSEIYDVHKILNIVDDIKISKIGWVGHVARMEDERVLMGNFLIGDQW